MPADLLRQHRHLDVLVVFEAVADDGRIVVGQRHHGHQLGLRAGLQTEVERLAEFQHLFHHLPLLVDLDRVHAAVLALVVVLADGRLKRGVELAQTVLQNVGEANQNGQVDAAQHQRVDQLLQIDGARRVFFGMDPHVPVIAHREIAFAPTGDVVEIAGGFRGPAFRRLHHQGALASISFQLARFSLIHQCPSKAADVARRNS